MARSDFERELQGRLKGAKGIVILAVGDELDPRDCIGLEAGKRISLLRLRNVKVLLTSQMPENYTSAVRELKPTNVVLIDAAEMGERPGHVAFIDPDRIAATRVSTHAMPLSATMRYLEKELGVKVELIGIQPVNAKDLRRGSQSNAVERGIDRIVAGFSRAVDRRKQTGR